MNPAEAITKTFQFKIGNTTFQPAYWHAAAIVFLLFLLIITMAQVRRHLMDYSLRGSFFGIFLGFLLALVVEGFFILSGRTILTNVLGWKNAPKPISNALDAGKSKLVDVLGNQASPQQKEKLSQDQIIESYQSLNPDIQRIVRSTICSP